MRCRKLRSLLPAYCNGELDSSPCLALERHLERCSACSREHKAHQLVANGVAEIVAGSSVDNSDTTLGLPVLRVSEDFNSRLLARISKERLSEVADTSSAPVFASQRFSFARSTPVFVTVTAMAAVLIAVFGLDISEDTNQTAIPKAPAGIELVENAGNIDNSLPLGASLGLRDDYLTAVPVDNPTFASSSAVSSGSRSREFASNNGASLVSATDIPMSPTRLSQWQFTRELARAQRLMEIANSLGHGYAYFEVSFFNAPGQGRSFVLVERGPFVAPGSRRISPQVIIRPANTVPVNSRHQSRPALGGSF